MPPSTGLSRNHHGEILDLETYADVFIQGLSMWNESTMKSGLLGKGVSTSKTLKPYPCIILSFLGVVFELELVSYIYTPN
jgi:hypothetical protein